MENDILPDSLVAGHEVELSGWIRTEGDSAELSNLLLALPQERDSGPIPFQNSEFFAGSAHDKHSKSGWHRMTLRRQVPDSAAGIYIGGMLTGSGSAWFDDLEVRIDGRKLRDTVIPELKYRLTPREKRELSRYIYPLQGCDPADGDSVELRLLDRLVGADYITFGFTFCDGRYTIIKSGVRKWQHNAQETYPGTLEYLLRQLDEPLFILDLKRMREEHAPALEWLKQMKFRHVGSMKLEDEFWDHDIVGQYDYLVFISNVSPSEFFLDFE